MMLLIRYILNIVGTCIAWFPGNYTGNHVSTIKSFTIKFNYIELPNFSKNLQLSSYGFNVQPFQSIFINRSE